MQAMYVLFLLHSISVAFSHLRFNVTDFFIRVGEEFASNHDNEKMQRLCYQFKDNTI